MAQYSAGNAEVTRQMLQTAGYRWRQQHFVGHVALAAVLTPIGIAALAAAVITKDASARAAAIPFGLIVLFVAWTQYAKARLARALNGRVRRILQNGLPVTGYLVQANQALFAPGAGPLPCLVLFSFQPEVGGNADYMSALAQSIYALKGTPQDTPDGRTVANFTTDERAYLDRRRLVPTSFTGGSTVYCADLMIDRTCLPQGYLTEHQLPCLAEQVTGNGLLLIPPPVPPVPSMRASGFPS